MNNIQFKHYLLDPDNTEKFVFQDENGILEIVRINTKKDRDIYCIPSMYECRLGCTMCYLTINNIRSSSKKLPYNNIEYCIKYILDYTETEVNVKNITVHDKNCIGCKKHDKYIMISYMDHNDKNNNIIDLFLTQNQAYHLLNTLKQKIDENSSN